MFGRYRRQFYKSTITVLYTYLSTQFDQKTIKSYKQIVEIHVQQIITDTVNCKEYKDLYIILHKLTLECQMKLETMKTSKMLEKDIPILYRKRIANTKNNNLSTRNNQVLLVQQTTT